MAVGAQQEKTGVCVLAGAAVVRLLRSRGGPRPRPAAREPRQGALALAQRRADRLQHRCAELAAKPDEVRDILADGADRARTISREVLSEVQDRMGLPPAASLTP